MFMLYCFSHGTGLGHLLFCVPPKQLLCKMDVYKDTYLGLSYRQTVNVTSTEETSTEKRTKSVSKSAAPPCRITSLSIH